MRSRCSSRTARRAPMCARNLPRRRIWRARWRGSCCSAAARAISRRSATGLRRRASSRAGFEPIDGIPAELAAAAQALVDVPVAIAGALSAALADDLPHMKRDGGFVRAGYDAALDETRALRDESRRVVAALQARYADETGVRALKVRHNNVLGYFVEVTAQHGEKMLAAAAQRDLHPSPDARRAGALHHHRARRARGEDRERGGPRARHGA